MSLYFRPEKAVLGDVIPYYDNGVFKPFYLRNYRANRDEQHQDSWVMLSTTDHIHYTEHDTKIVGGTGSVIKVDGLYHMFYCTFQKLPEKNYMNHAVSTDLDVWTEIPEDRFADPLERSVCILERGGKLLVDDFCGAEKRKNDEERLCGSVQIEGSASLGLLRAVLCSDECTVCV